ncbi:MAG: hypothetical protein WKH64_10095 [Chloroflexia bacterium]
MSSLGRARPTATLAAALLALTVVLFAEDGIAASAGPSRLLLLTPEYEAAGRWLRENNTGGSIITSPYLNQATLAMGGYTLLPTVTENQADDGRTVPVRFQQHVRDVQWVYDHSRDERTNQIYALYDVRYLALAKSLPENAEARQGDGRPIQASPISTTWCSKITRCNLRGQAGQASKWRLHVPRVLP